MILAIFLQYKYKIGDLLEIFFFASFSMQIIFFANIFFFAKNSLLVRPVYSHYISGQVPYKGKTLPAVINFICDHKGHLDVPQLCPNELKELLIKCWSYDPNDRPSFDSLLQLIQQLLIIK